MIAPPGVADVVDGGLLLSGTTAGRSAAPGSSSSLPPGYSLEADECSLTLHGAPFPARYYFVPGDAAALRTAWLSLSAMAHRLATHAALAREASE